MYMCPCALCGARAARVAAMAREPLLHAIVLLLYACPNTEINETNPEINETGF